jgi:2-polyprenyl-3-methyl-5-hydroxy-6-metoxy-1,4-benzoquinol methylase
MFRYPKDTAKINFDYYQNDYSDSFDDDDRLQVPSPSQIETFRNSNFRGVNDYSPKIALLKTALSAGLILEFGCSWGYGLWQLHQAGYEVKGLEVNGKRAEIGRKYFNFSIVTSIEHIPDGFGPFDAIFANHVLEHLPDVRSAMAFFRNLLRPGGYLLAFVPDCSGCDTAAGFAEKRAFAFGEAHTIAFDQQYFQRNLHVFGFRPLDVSAGPGKTEMHVLAQRE